MKSTLDHFFACLQGVSWEALSSGKLDYFVDGKGPVTVRFEIGSALDLIAEKYDVSAFNWNREIIREFLRTTMDLKPEGCRLGGKVVRAFNIPVQDIYRATGIWMFPSPASAPAVQERAATQGQDASTAEPLARVINEL